MKLPNYPAIIVVIIVALSIVAVACTSATETPVPIVTSQVGVQPATGTELPEITQAEQDVEEIGSEELAGLADEMEEAILS
ncbi:TPA: hypothetical protein HA231_05335 [Candidatus Woesearchaeota archaeon]|nr:hypothetical protein [Candidatus Woesearchaeota archaeon]